MGTRVPAVTADQPEPVAIFKSQATLPSRAAALLRGAPPRGQPVGRGADAVGAGAAARSPKGKPLRKEGKGATKKGSPTPKPKRAAAD